MKSNPTTTPAWLRTLLATLLLIALGTSRTQASDFGYWQLYTLRGPLVKNLDWIFYPEVISDDGASSLSFLLLQEGLRYRAASWLELGVAYAYVRARSTSGNYITQHWEEPEATLNWNIAGVPITWRHRMEIRQRHDVSDRYRDRVGIASPIGWTPLHLVPYASYEYFYDFHRMAENQTRAIAGVRWSINPQTELSIYYLRQSLLGSTQWSTINYVGTEWRLLFGSSEPKIHVVR